MAGLLTLKKLRVVVFYLRHSDTCRMNSLDELETLNFINSSEFSHKNYVITVKFWELTLFLMLEYKRPQRTLKQFSCSVSKNINSKTVRQ